MIRGISCKKIYPLINLELTVKIVEQNLCIMTPEAP